MNSQEKTYTIKRYDSSTDRSLKPHSAADEYLLQRFAVLEKKPVHLTIYSDRFGFLSCHLHQSVPTIILTQKSQEKAIHSNLKANNIPLPVFSNPLSSFEKKTDLALLKIPKSLALFQLFLEQIANNSTKDVIVIAAFMTRHFSSNLLQIAGQYFENVEQSKALKKARLLVLSKKKDTVKQEIINTLHYQDQEYKQYWGVFSAKHIDYATQYFLNHLEVQKTDACLLDLASGNGIIAKELSKKLPEAEIHLMDDSYLAVSSAELNVQGENIHHHCNNDLSIFEDDTFDLIVTNPPFHFEYEINIQIPLQLFKECSRCLKKGGNLQLVANKHLNYKTHLISLFSEVRSIAEDHKFIIYKCIK